MKVLITGGSGLIGSRLTQKLKSEGVEVVHLTRYPNSKNGVKTYAWDWAKGQIDERCFEGVTHIVHLAGEGIADKPWTMERKRTIVKSRVLTARLIETKVRELNIPIEAFISASGIGYYGAITSETIFDEEGSRGDDFVAECCVQWEEAADKFNDLCRVVKLRTGVVLDNNGGAIPKMASPVKKGFGAALGKGSQYMPWIHHEDMVNIYLMALKNTKMSGVYNATSSVHTTNDAFTAALAKSMHKKIRLPHVPAFMMKLMFGEMAAILLEGSRVSNEKIKKEGFSFVYDDLDEALKNL
jgi:uncharacterized protein (TIGR01777 family)